MEELIHRLAKRLKNKDWRLVTAESCTGGGLAYYFSCSPRASSYLDRGYIVYSNASKIQILKVKQRTLEKYGPVSAKVAEEMAKAALKYSQAQLSIAITGLAGPEGDGTATPVGTIWFGLSKKGKTVSYVNFYKGKRKIVLNKIIRKALEYAINFIEEN